MTRTLFLTFKPRHHFSAFDGHYSVRCAFQYSSARSSKRNQLAQVKRNQGLLGFTHGLVVTFGKNQRGTCNRQRDPRRESCCQPSKIPQAAACPLFSICALPICGFSFVAPPVFYQGSLYLEFGGYVRAVPPLEASAFLSEFGGFCARGPSSSEG